jgi:hypothetical protein
VRQTELVFKKLKLFEVLKVIKLFYKNNFNLMELCNGNITNGEDNIGELLTGNADDNAEGMD